MTLLKKFKAIFNTAEAQEFKKELQETTKEVSNKVETKTKSVVENIKNKTTDKREETTKESEESSDAEYLSFDDFMNVEMRVGTILSVEEIEKSEKLLLLSVDLGEESPRQVVSGIKTYFEDPQSLVGTQATFVANLAPRKIFGYESQGMIMALNDKDSFSLLTPTTKIESGTKVS